ncbi:type I 3-dehydroquinate dehydratase, partial [Neisseria meningitidis]|nr:type I 3-dehydroquinate dehydratase [Neisseria meningitidis]
MCSCLVVKNTVIGSGRTKIAVPLVARDAAELSAVLEQIKNLPFDIAEFRADFLECAGSIGEILHHTQTVRDALPNKPLLFTFRRHGEGGSFPCSDDYYFKLLDALIESRLPDIIDIELFSGETAVRRAVANAQKNGIAALLCNHEFHRTPPQEEIVCRLKQMEDCGADICKIAVMPQSAEDV